MFFTLAVLALAVGASYVRGGRLRRVADAPLRWSWLLFAGVGLQAITGLAAGAGWLPDAEVPTYLLILTSQLLVVLWVGANWHLPGMILVCLGLALNAVVMAANGAMPVDPEAVAALGIGEVEVAPGKHTLLTEDTRLPWLADIWPIPPLRSIISVGDVVLAAGLLPLAHALMTYEPTATRRRRRQTAPADEA